MLVPVTSRRGITYRKAAREDTFDIRLLDLRESLAQAQQQRDAALPTGIYIEEVVTDEQTSNDALTQVSEGNVSAIALIEPGHIRTTPEPLNSQRSG